MVTQTKRAMLMLNYIEKQVMLKYNEWGQHTNDGDDALSLFTTTGNWQGTTTSFEFEYFDPLLCLPSRRLNRCRLDW
jgi:hypothetical protein